MTYNSDNIIALISFWALFSVSISDLKYLPVYRSKQTTSLPSINITFDLDIGFSSKEEFLASDFQGTTVAEKLIEQTGVIGEKIEIGSFETIEGPFLGAYIHAGNKIAAITSLSADVDGASEAAKAVSMQVAAMNPIALDETMVSQEVIDRELDIEREILTKEGKPANIIDNILKGKMQKFYKDNTLVHQAFIKDSGVSVADYVKSVNGDLKVVGFVRVSLA